MDPSSFFLHSNQARPFFHVRGIPFYLSTILVAVHIVAILLSVAIPDQLEEAVIFMPGWVAKGHIWRVVSYSLLHIISIHTVIDMIFLFFCGRQLEELYGAKSFGILYLLSIVVPSAVLMGCYAFTGNNYFLMGTHWPHYMLLLSVAFVQPNAYMFVCWLKLKWVALAYFVVEVLQLLKYRQLAMILAYVVTAAVIYLWLRRCGLGTRFDGVLETLGDFKPRFLERKPKLRVLEGGSPRPKNPGTYYEPKIKPRAELDREHPAVVEIDALLDKISREGFGSLTDEEKKALDRASSELKDKDKRL